MRLLIFAGAALLLAAALHPFIDQAQAIEILRTAFPMVP